MSGVDGVDCANDGLDSVRNFEDRLITFTNWPSKVNPKELACAGFYYTQKNDIVRCAFCSCEFHNWREGDDPLEDHYRSVKYCDFARVLFECRKKSPISVTTRKAAKPKTINCSFSILYFSIIFIIFLSIFSHQYEVLKELQKRI